MSRRIPHLCLLSVGLQCFTAAEALNKAFNIRAHLRKVRTDLSALSTFSPLALYKVNDRPCFFFELVWSSANPLALSLFLWSSSSSRDRADGGSLPVASLPQ